MYVVIIEWDGRKPPTAFYRRLYRLAARGVRGDKAVPALERRLARRGPGIVVQEGAIIVPSQSLARLVAFLARGYGAAYVQVGRVRPEPDLAPTPEDAEAMRRVEAVLGRRGRPSVKRVWTVSCHECLAVHRVEAVAPLNCPACGGVMIRIRPGEPPRFRDPGGPLWSAWLRTRFSRGVWEPAATDGNDLPPERVAVEDPREREAVARMRQAEGLLEALGHLDRPTALQVLDAVLAARAYWPRERRQVERLEAAAAYFRQGGDPAGVVLAEGEVPDLLDAAGPLGAEEVAALMQVINATNVRRIRR